MSTFGYTLYQIVFSTKNRENTLVKSGREELYRYIWGVLKNKRCYLYRIGGVEDHLHIIAHIHPAQSVSDLVKDIKLSATAHIKEKALFKDFGGWQNGYGYFTYNQSSKDNLIQYVKIQETHHHKKSFKEELIELLEEHDMEFDERYLD